MKRRLALVLIGAMLAASACTHWSAPAARPYVPLPRMYPGDSAVIRAGKLAEYIQRRWPRVTVSQIEADAGGKVVSYQDQPRYDYSIKDPVQYEAHVTQVTADLAEASVELLKLTMHYFPHMQFASVFQDAQLKAYWTPEGIDAMGSPESYRSYKSFLRLIMTAQFPPLGVQAPPAPTS